MVYIQSSPQQTLLLPTNLRDIIPKDHMCYLIEDVVNQLDFSSFDKEVEGPGNPSYHPRIQLKIIVNGVCERVTSTRKLEKLTYENIIFKYLAENLNPDFHTIALFRKYNRELIRRCFLETIEVAKQLDMINFNKIYLDGIKVKANASKSKTFTKEEIDFLSEFVDKHLNEMDRVDEEENMKYGDSNGEPRIPEHLTGRRKLKDKIKQILKDRETGKKQINEAKEKIIREKADEVNLTDMDSKLMKMKKGMNYEQAYNCQLLVEDKSEVIVGNHLSDSPVDTNETIPVMEKFKQEQKISLKCVEVFQDNAYSSVTTAEYYKKEKAIAYIPDSVTTKELHGKEKEIPRFHNDNFKLDFKKNQAICPVGHRMHFSRRAVDKRKSDSWTNVYRTDKCKGCEFQRECVGKDYKKHPYRKARINPLMREIRLRFKTKKGIKKYNKRFHKGEVAQAHIEHNLGYREFKCRGIKACENEVDLFSTAHNLRKIYNKLREKGMELKARVRKLFFWLNYVPYL